MTLWKIFTNSFKKKAVIDQQCISNYILGPNNCRNIKFMMVSNCPRCQIVRGVKLSSLHGRCQIVLFCMMVSNCPRCQIVRGVKLSSLPSWCQIVLLAIMVSNCPKCQMVLGVKLSAVSNGPRISFLGLPYGTSYFFLGMG